MSILISLSVIKPLCLDWILDTSTHFILTLLSDLFILEIRVIFFFEFITLYYLSFERFWFTLEKNGWENWFVISLCLVVLWFEILLESTHFDVGHAYAPPCSLHNDSEKIIMAKFWANLQMLSCSRKYLAQRTIIIVFNHSLYN